MRIAVMGSVGCGKTTLGQHLAKTYDYLLVSEPTGHEFMGDLLNLFYRQKEKFAFLAQFRAFSNIYLEMIKANKESRVVFDSTLFTNRIFVEQIYKSLLSESQKREGILSSENVYSLHKELDLFRSQFDSLFLDICPIDKYILLNCDISWCLNNVHARDRKFEKGQDTFLREHHSTFYQLAKELFQIYKIPASSISEIYIDHDPEYHFLKRFMEI